MGLILMFMTVVLVVEKIIFHFLIIIQVYSSRRSREAYVMEMLNMTVPLRKAPAILYQNLDLQFDNSST